MQLKAEGVLFHSQFRIESTKVGNSRHWELGAAGHIAPSVGKQRGMDASLLVLSSLPPFQQTGRDGSVTNSEPCSRGLKLDFQNPLQKARNVRNPCSIGSDILFLSPRTPTLTCTSVSHVHS